MYYRFAPVRVKHGNHHHVEEGYHVVKEEACNSRTYSARMGKIPITIDGITDPGLHTLAWYSDLRKKGGLKPRTIADRKTFCCKPLLVWSKHLVKGEQGTKESSKDDSEGVDFGPGGKR